MTTQNKYTDEQIRFVLEARLTRALEFRDIAREYQKKWGGKRTPEQMRHLYRGHADELKAITHPLADFTHSGFAGVVREATATRGRWFVTAASPVSELSVTKKNVGRNLFAPALDAVKLWMAQTGGDLVLLPMRAHVPALTEQPAHYDTRLLEFRDKFAMEFKFNRHLRALDVHMNPQQIAPLTGLHRIRSGQTHISVGGIAVPTRFNQSLIFAHAKQDMEPVPTGNSTLPRLLHTTGAITLPEYLPNRIGAIARDTHILGGLIVEVDEDKFWIRQVEFGPDGSFYDLGRRYSPERVSTARAVAFRLGDVHGGREEQPVLDAQSRLSALVKPKQVFVEDLLDFSAANHHDEHKRFTRAQRVFRTIEDELEYDATLLASIEQTICRDVVVVASNHHEHLISYLDQGKYIKDENHEIGHRMVVEMYDGVDPLQKRLDPKQKYTWLTTEDDYLVEGVQMAGHGHLGVNGMRGSPQQLEKAYVRGMTGHSHTPGARGRLFTVGHASMRRHGYNRGITTWLNTCGLVWPGGQCQLLTLVNGRLYLDDAVPGAGGTK